MIEFAETKIHEALLGPLKALATAENIPAAIPNKEFDPVSYPYIEVENLPSNSSSSFVSTTRDIRGIFLVTLVEKRNKGIISSKNLVSKITSSYPMGTRLFKDEVCVQINRQPNERTPIFEDDEMRIPITIPYQSYI